MQSAVSMLLLIGALAAVVTHAKKNHHLLQRETPGLGHEMGLSHESGFSLNLVVAADQTLVEDAFENTKPGWALKTTTYAPNYCYNPGPDPFISGYVTNTCFLFEGGEEGISYLFTCNNDGTVSEWSFYSTNCDFDRVRSVSNNAQGCQWDMRDFSIRNRYSCTNSSTAQLGGQYILTEEYVDDQCSGHIFAFSGYLNNYCMPEGDTSTQYVYPNILFYPDSGDCNGTSFSDSFPSPDQCVGLEDGDTSEFAARDQVTSVQATNIPTSSLRGPKHLRNQQANRVPGTPTKHRNTGISVTADDDGRLRFPYSRTVLASNVTTSSSVISMPTFMPTSSPDLVIRDQTLRYTVYQVLNNIDAATYEAGWTVNNQVISSTVATYVTGVFTNNINMLSAQNSVSTTSTSEMRVAASSTLITYTVYIPSTRSAGYPNAMNAYTLTTESLNSSLKNGFFTSTMQATARSLGATSLASASSSQATASSPEITDAPGGGSVLSPMGVIIIAVVCSVGGLGLVIGVAYCMTRVTSAKSKETKVVAHATTAPSNASQAGGAGGMEMGQMGTVVAKSSATPVRLGASS